jgi:hypothetical protein
LGNCRTETVARFSWPFASRNGSIAQLSWSLFRRSEPLAARDRKHSITQLLNYSIFLLLSFPVLAQQNAPHAAYVYPAGGRAGTTFEVTVGGQHLDGANEVYLSGGGVKAEVIDFTKPLPPQQVQDLREQLKKLREKNAKGGWSPEDRKSAADMRQKLALTVRGRANPALAETARLRVTISPQAAPGERDLRLEAKTGMTNPLVFCVDQLPEFSRRAAADAAPAPEEPGAKGRKAPAKPAAPEPPMDITVPAIVNGEIMPSSADRYRFPARRGQRLVMAARTRELIPYISDAVPGWFQAALTLFDSQGSELAHADHYRFQQDPVLLYEVPADGDYVLEIRDSIYRGREDFVYRLSVGELPFVTSVFPLGGRTGIRTPIQLTGWSLPLTQTVQTLEGEGIRTVSLREGGWTSNPLLLDADTLPETGAADANDSVAHAQSVKLPVIVNGRIEHPDESRVFRFKGRKGEEIVAEVMARRLNSPLDSVLRLTDAKGKELAYNDDFDDKGSALITHQADSRLSLKLPAKGTYFLYLGDAQHNGGPEYGYRLRLDHARPDFALRVVPSSVNLRPGTTAAVSVYALRRDGFAGDIVLRLKEAPPGLVLTGGRILAGQDSARVTLGAPPDAPAVPQRFTLEGEAVIAGRAVRHAGVPAEDMTQAFAWHHLVPAQDGFVYAGGQGRRNPPWRFADDKPVRLPAGGTAQLRLLLPGQSPDQVAGRVHLQLDAAPEGIALDGVSSVGGALAIRLRTDAAKVKPGLKGNLIVDVSMDMPAPADDGKQQAKNRRVPLGVLPAVAFEVVAR